MASIAGRGNEDDFRRCTKLLIEVKMSISETWSFGFSYGADYAS
jgi:alpha/beta superfamily hydrolase